MKNSTTLEEIKEVLFEKYLESLEENGIEYMESDQVGFTDNPFWESFIKPEYDLTDDEMALELGYIDFADFIKEYLREELMIKQPDWITEWTRENLKAGVC